jgi:hypothetical protein
MSAEASDDQLSSAQLSLLGLKAMSQSLFTSSRELGRKG